GANSTRRAPSNGRNLLSRRLKTGIVPPGRASVRCETTHIGSIAQKGAKAPKRSLRENIMKTFTPISLFGACALVLAAAPASAAWEPTKPVEIVVAAGAGGASDQMARMMQAAIQKNNLMKAPMVVSLKGGASGAEALMYMKSGAGDAN